MKEDGRVDRELKEVNREISNWPEWMQREARFEGDAKWLEAGNPERRKAEDEKTKKAVTR